jgi:hypothetical protein
MSPSKPLLLGCLFGRGAYAPSIPLQHFIAPQPMPRSPKSWRQKMAAKPPHMVMLGKEFAGVPAGARLLTARRRARTSCALTVRRAMPCRAQ